MPRSPIDLLMSACALLCCVVGVLLSDAATRNVSIRRIQPHKGSLDSPTHASGHSVSVAADLPAGTGSARESRRHHGRKAAKPINMFDADFSAAAGASTVAAAPSAALPAASGLDSKRTVRKKVLAPAPGGDGGGGGMSSVRGAPKGGSPGLASERLRARGSVLQPVSTLAPPGSSAQLARGVRSARVSDAAEDSAQPPSPALSAADSDEEADEFARRFGRGAQRDKGGGAPALRGARMDDGSGLDPGYQDLVRANPLLWADPEWAVTFPEQVFAFYTAHQRSSFERKEPRQQLMDISALTKLANDAVERFLQRHRILIAKTNPKFTPTQVELSLLHELPHTPMGCLAAAVAERGEGPASATSPGLGLGLGGLGLRKAPPADPLPEIKSAVLHFLKRELDKDRDFRVSKTDFLMQWKPTVTKLMKIDAPTKDICVIL